MHGFQYAVLLNYSGTQSKPITNISVRGMTLRDTAYTYLDPHGAPSAGDWCEHSKYKVCDNYNAKSPNV